MKVNIFKLQLAYTIGRSFKETRLKSERFGINTSYILASFSRSRYCKLQTKVFHRFIPVWAIN